MKKPTGKKHRLIIVVDFYRRREGPEPRERIVESMHRMMRRYAPKIVVDNIFCVRDDEGVLTERIEYLKEPPSHEPTGEDQAVETPGDGN